jgi:hypothetical protein
MVRESLSRLESEEDQIILRDTAAMGYAGMPYSFPCRSNFNPLLNEQLEWILYGYFHHMF